MDEAAVFRCDQCRGDLLRDIDGCAHTKRSCAANAFLQRLTLDQFHRVKELACFLADSELEHGGDVFVSQRSGRAGFAQKTFARFSASRGDADSYDLQRDLALERRVDGAIGRAHPAMPELVKTSVLAALNLVDSKMPRSR